MAKIKLMTDSACDIPDDDILRLNIDMRNIPIAVDGKGYFERKDFTTEEFYDILAGSKEIPVTSRISTDEYIARYKKTMEYGYTDLINVTINAGGSGIFAAATLAKERFYAEVPGAKEKLAVHVVDSGTYSLAYGWPVMEAARMALEERPVEEILTYLEEYFASVEVYLGIYTLEYAKKSGRIGAAAAFVGDVLGLRPIIAMIGGKTWTDSKVRGERNIAPRILEAYRENCADSQAPVAVVCGSELQYGEELAGLFENEFGVRPPIYRVGASVAINSGHRMLAVVCSGKRR